MNREKERNSSYELLKIISMFLTVLYHIILHEKVFENCKNEELKSILTILKKYSNGNINFNKQFYEKSYIKENSYEEIINGKFS